MEYYTDGSFESTILVRTMPNLESVLAQEITGLGLPIVREHRRMIETKGNLMDVYRCNLHLRTALRVLLPIHEFAMRQPDDLYRKALKLDWSSFIGINQTFAIDSTVHSTYFKHNHFASLRLKDAIADAFMQKHHRRPNVDPDAPDVLIHLHIDEREVTISLDSSGHSLNRRGYRVNGGKAPLNEVLAAAMVLQSGWNGQRALLDPMCGSGTLLIEAAMIACRMAPQSLCDDFGFMHWNNFNRAGWKQIQQEASDAEIECHVPIVGNDADGLQLKFAKANLEEIGLQELVELRHADFTEIMPHAESGTIIVNPPYGLRVDDDIAPDLYRRMGSHWKHHFAGWDAWIISSNLEALKQIGLKHAKKLVMKNGQLDCRFMQFELFKGKRIEHKYPELS